MFEIKNAECEVLPAGFSEQSFKRIVAMQSLFPISELRYSEKDIRENLENPRAIHVFLKRVESVYGDGDDIGCIASFPHDEIVDELSDQDPLMEKDAGRYYIDQLFIVPDEREGLTFLMLVDSMVDELIRRHIHRISSHILATNGLHTIIARSFRRRLTKRRQNVRMPAYRNLVFDYMEANCQF